MIMSSQMSMYNKSSLAYLSILLFLDDASDGVSHESIDFLSSVLWRLFALKSSLLEWSLCLNQFERPHERPDLVDAEFGCHAGRCDGNDMRTEVSKQAIMAASSIPSHSGFRGFLLVS